MIKLCVGNEHSIKMYLLLKVCVQYILVNAEMGCICIVAWTDGCAVLLGCKEGLLRGSSAPLLPLFSLTHYPGGSVLALQSGLLLLLINLQKR